MCIAVLSWVLAIGACTDAGPTTTTSQATSAAPLTTVAPATVDATSEGRLAQPLPLDPDVTIGRLDNGLTYYVRENRRPGNRAQLRLVVDAGSSLEDGDQSGAAHFVEHMLFNGTERFPVNELTSVLESFGARFGPDVNAYTTYDETVYELAVPTSEPALLELGLDVLLEWAAHALIDQADVEAERGVVLEEWRLRNAGVGGRIAQVYEDVFLAGTGYEGRSPIGDPEALRTTSAATLRRFYDDWYRPGLMAVVAVGDFDADRVIELIRDRFDALEPPAAPRQRREVVVPAFTSRRIGVLADPDQPTASVEIYFPAEANRGSTIGDRRNEWARLLAADMIVTRLNDDVTRGAAPFFSASPGGFDFARRLTLQGVAVDAASDQILDALQAIVIEVARAERHGFGAAEFLRSRRGWEAAIAQSFAGRASTQDFEFAARYVTHFLAGGGLPSPQQEFELDTELLDSLTAQDAWAALRELTAASALSAVIIGPDDGGVPSEATIDAAVVAAAGADVAPRPPDEDVGEVLLATPDPVEPLEVTALPLGIVELLYPNGVRVRFVQTDISVNEVVMGASSPGGMSRVSDEDVAEAFLIADIVGRSGVGPFDRVALETALADQVVALQPYIDVIEEGFFASAASEDLETLMQLIHLTMVAPRADEGAAAAVIGELRRFAESPETIPGLATTLELIRQRWGDEPRYRALLTTEELDDYDLAAADAVYRDRFADAGDFVFAFAGDFSSVTIRELSDSYLGTLPATDRDDSWIDHQRAAPATISDTTIAVGESEQGFVTFLFTGDFRRDPRRDVHVELLSLIADVKLRDRLREALAATYSPFVSIVAADAPDEIIETYLQVSGDPSSLDVIVDESLDILASLVRTGPTEAELATAKEQLSRQYELVSNEWWIDQMLFSVLHPDESLRPLSARFDFVAEATAADIQSVAAAAFPSDRYVLVRQIPG